MSAASLPQVSEQLEAWKEPQYRLTTLARQGQSVSVREFPWLLARRIIGIVRSQLAPAFSAAYRVYQLPRGAEQEQAILALLEEHAPLLFELPGLAEDLVSATTGMSSEELAQLNSRDILSLAILSLRVLLVEFSDAAGFFTSALSAGLSGLSAAEMNEPSNSSQPA